MPADANGNGNGHAAPNTTLSKRTHHVNEEPLPARELMELPPWLKALRDAMGSSIAGDDLKQIMAKQIELAKEGDMKSAQFVMNQAHKMLQAETKRVTIVQNNYYDTPEEKRPDAPIQPGEDEQRIARKFRARAAAGVPVAGRGGDRRTRPVSDEEEKELHRRQDEREAD